MVRMVRACLVALLCLAVLAPPRLHAAAVGHAGHGDAPLVMAMPDHHHDHVSDPARAKAMAQFSADMCLAACACLPAGPLPLPVAHLSGAGEKLVPRIVRVAERGETGGPFRPPRCVS